MRNLSAFIAIVLLAGCCSHVNDETAAGPVRATWFRTRVGFMDEIGWQFNGRPVERKPGDVLQAHVLDDLEASGVLRAMEKTGHPAVRAEGGALAVGEVTGCKWEIPGRGVVTRVEARVTRPHVKYHDVELICDGKPLLMKVPEAGFVLVFGLPSDPGLVGLLAF